MENKIDHEYTKEIVCPYCGYSFRDSWEFHPDYSEINCGGCEKEFIYERNITVDYSTKKIN